MCFLKNPIIPLGKMAFFVIYHQNNTFKKKKSCWLVTLLASTTDIL